MTSYGCTCLEIDWILDRKKAKRYVPGVFWPLEGGLKVKVSKKIAKKAAREKEKLMRSTKVKPQRLMCMKLPTILHDDRITRL
jgi:hypothetical protein